MIAPGVDALGLEATDDGRHVDGRVPVHHGERRVHGLQRPLQEPRELEVLHEEAQALMEVVAVPLPRVLLVDARDVVDVRVVCPVEQPPLLRRQHPQPVEGVQEPTE